jgi:hypothetical protein
VTGITLDSSPFWTFVARGARNLVIDRVSITTPSCAGGKNTGYDAAPNTDGFNIGGSEGIVRFLRVSSLASSTDDALASSRMGWARTDRVLQSPLTDPFGRSRRKKCSGLTRLLSIPWQVITNSYVRNRDDCVPLFPPVRNVTVRNITCECGNGLVPCTWPEGSRAGMGGDISDVLFEGATFIRSQVRPSTRT